MDLDENYRILYDETNVILQFHELRIKGEKAKNKGEQFEFTQDYFYPNIKSALKSYINKSLKGSNSILDLVCRIEDLENRVSNIKLNNK